MENKQSVLGFHIKESDGCYTLHHPDGTKLDEYCYSKISYRHDIADTAIKTYLLKKNKYSMKQYYKNSD